MSDVNSSVPHSARIWNYWLGGKDFYPADKAMGDQIMEFFPEIVENARGNRYFLCRVVRHLVADAGVTQFLDVGTGLPTADNTHEIAQRVDPASRIVYVDNDPLVLAHAHALLTGTPEGAIAYLDADVEDPDKILREAAETLDFDKPIALVMVGIMQFVKDLDRAYAIVRRLVEALPSGSHLVLTHPTNAVRGARMDEAVRQWNEGGGSPELTLRTVAEVEPFFAGLDLLDPGLVSTADWRPDLADDPLKVDDHGAVARKP
ncbi:SAM-dependent methyltransferase [Actinomadura algeriensis]|uniref:O-methyltransferase involved in polyketide biosynthesis n=1 Tax=Actinomadura algeriensis TaxID=1679523 RepID=A0ABR9JKW7_9ACTN|nr:SAM-dependent methyltransferase [Actinomadura algeriensis]MBE1531197.1 O-methyltransferase involved in polyketide biosynthesis [Actinomadura algeriensis]